MIIQRHYENLNIMYENTMPYRSYYIPASCNMGPLVENREKSDRMTLLNGNGNFVILTVFTICRMRFTRKDIHLTGLKK